MTRSDPSVATTRRGAGTLAARVVPALFACTALSLGGCGQKGPLALPEAQTPQAVGIAPDAPAPPPAPPAAASAPVRP